MPKKKDKRKNNNLQRHLHKKSMIEQPEHHQKPGVNSGATEVFTVPSLLMALVVLLQLQTRLCNVPVLHFENGSDHMNHYLVTGILFYHLANCHVNFCHHLMSVIIFSQFSSCSL